MARRVAAANEWPPEPNTWTGTARPHNPAERRPKKDNRRQRGPESDTQVSAGERRDKSEPGRRQRGRAPGLATATPGVAHPPAITTGRAVCVGCGGHTMARDARDMAAALESLGFNPPCVLLGDAAAREAVLAAIRSAFDSSTEDDVTVVFFSGHGDYGSVDDELWLLPGGSPPSVPNPEAVGVSAREIREMAVKAQSHSMVVLDCCYSGALVKQNNLGRLSKKWKQGAGRLFLTSSGDNDVTYHMAGARNSALTSAVLGQLRSGVTKAQSVARGVQAHFAEHPYWGRSMKAEERGSEFSLYHPRAPA
eukprot:m.362522 g.362522  ORF g.362522 m.362522 type:complete len:308 (-) comp16650_c1_seq1:313-1236(-)